MALVGYARVSTRDQSLDVQIDQLRNAGCEHVFAEKRSGTTTTSREEFDACLRFVRNGDVLVVTRMDRVGRSVTDFFKIMTTLEEKGVEFRCLLQPMIDTTDKSPMGKMVRTIMMSFAEFETGIRRERQREGIERAREAGIYRIGKKRNGKISWARTLLNQGAPYREAAEKSGIPENTLRRRYPEFSRGRHAGRYDLGAVEADHEPGNHLTLPPSAAPKPVDEDPSPKPEAPKHGLFSSFRRP